MDIKKARLRDRLVVWLAGVLGSHPAEPRVIVIDNPAVPNTVVLYLSPERALHELRHDASAMEDRLRYENDFIAFARGQTGHGAELPEVLKKTVETGSALFGGYVHGQHWFRSERLRKMFEESLALGGFKAVYRVHESEGPEADSWTYTITVPGYASPVRPRRPEGGA